jgi:hypothetical protein
MKKTSVSLLVTSQTMSLAELTSKLGRAPAFDSHSRGDAAAGAKLGKPPWPVTVWRFDSDTLPTAPVQEHLERLEILFPAAELKRVLPGGCEVSVDVVLFFDTFTVSATIPRRGIAIINAYNAELEITCYPSTFES